MKYFFRKSNTLVFSFGKYMFFYIWTELYYWFSVFYYYMRQILTLFECQNLRFGLILKWDPLDGQYHVVASIQHRQYIFHFVFVRARYLREILDPQIIHLFLSIRHEVGKNFGHTNIQFLVPHYEKKENNIFFKLSISSRLDVVFRQISTFLELSVAFAFGLCAP